MNANASISPELVERGRWVYTAWKHLRLYSLSTAVAFDATIQAGKIGDLLGRMRHLAAYPYGGLIPLAKDANIGRTELDQIVVPLLDALGIFAVDRHNDGRIHSIRALVLSQDDVMDQIGRIWEQARPEPAERGALTLLQATATLPLTKTEALEQLRDRAGLDESDALEGVELALSHELIRKCYVADFEMEFYYNDFLWGDDIQKTTNALGGLPSHLRSGLASLLDELHAHEGRPLADLESAEPQLANLAVAHGIVDATEIRTAEGKKATFCFTPRFRGIGVSRDQPSDALDHVKLIVASFGFATRFARYKLRDPERFLDNLIDRGYAGNASPIGTDYGALERQKIVNVEPVSEGSTRFRFQAVKTDSLIEARDAMRAGSLLIPNLRGTEGALLREPQRFVDPVACRDKARRPGDRPIYDAQLLAAIRDAAQQDQFR